MPLTLIDPKAALIVIDMQKGIAAYPMAHPLSDVVARVNELVDAFHSCDLPVVFVVAAGGSPGRTERPSHVPAELPADATDLLPDLHYRANDHRVVKYARGAFSNTGLEEHFKKLGVTQVVIAGIATSNGVESTARQAYEAGLNVTLPIDAMTDGTLEGHELSLKRVFPRLAETGSTEAVVAMLSSSQT